MDPKEFMEVGDRRAGIIHVQSANFDDKKQATKDYYKEYFAVTEPMFVKPREFKILNRLGAPYYMAKD